MTRSDVPRDLSNGASPLKAEPTLVVPGIYLLGKTSPGAAYAVDTSDGIVLVDSGLEAGVVIKQLSELGLDPARVKAVLITHVHGDHSLGAARFRDEYGARIYAGLGDCPPLRAGGPREAFFSIYQMPGVAIHPTQIDVALNGGELIEVGDAVFRVFAAPGHTPGSVCYLLERRGLRALFVGDVIQSLNPATRNVLGTYAAYLPPRFRGNAADYLATLRRLRDLSVPDLVLPGHPSMDKPPENPQIGVERWNKLLGDGIAEMERLKSRLETDGANFLDGVPKRLLPGLYYLGDLNESALYILSNEKGLFVFDAPGAALNARVTKSLRELGVTEQKVSAVILTDAGPPATSGLGEFVRATKCRVVVPKAGLDSVRRLCPEGTELLTEDDLAKAGWFEVRPITLSGRGIAPVAYEVRCAERTVLFSGRIPVRLETQPTLDLIRDVPRTEDGREAYRQSLGQLRQRRPDLWLPAIPVNGQNANLYDNEWVEVLAANAELFP
jgi:glyoxylase-like metal-dependent hydrolase (beta-lactamase superfamily II)